jgi:glutaredoxin
MLRLFVVVIFGCVSMFSAMPISAEIYKWIDGDGKVHFGDQPPSAANAERLDLRINTYTSPEETDVGNDFGAVKKVTMYGASWCAVCKKARKYFRAKGIAFVEYDIEKSSKGKRDFKRLGGKGVPIILVGGKRLNGFSEGTFEKLYY